ncbi:MAG: lipase family protein [Isosphaeraceae bacterium]
MTRQLRPMPLETLQGLVPPPSSFPYFAHPEGIRFDPAAAGDHPANASWLADASLLVYGDATFIRDVFQQSPLPEQGYDLSLLAGDNGNRGMLLQSDSAMVFVFRGTRLETHTVLDAAEVVILNQDDLWTDSQFLPAACRAGGKVHAGFLKAFSEVAPLLDELAAKRLPRQRVWLTGHSLGGSLATLAAAHLGPDAIQGLYTFGCPRVGDAAFASVLPTRSYVRFVHRDDWVPTVPTGLLGYVHGGTLRQVPSPPRNFFSDFTTGAKELAATLRAMAANSNLNTGSLPFKISGLADHAPVYYATLLWNALVETREASG